MASCELVAFVMIASFAAIAWRGRQFLNNNPGVKSAAKEVAAAQTIKVLGKLLK
jgi:hypothetical protein